MTTSRSEDLLVGIIAFALVPWSIFIIRRGLRGGKLPIGRGYVLREERAAPFNLLLLLYGLVAAGALYISMDLIFGMGGGR